MAAKGDWELAAVVASDELPGGHWDAASLREFVAGLVPGNDQDPQTTAAEFHMYLDVGLVTPERCVDAWGTWSWLALRAWDDWQAAVEAARDFFGWHECTVEWVDHLLCRLMERGDDDVRQAAKDTYWCVLTDVVTEADVIRKLTELLREAGDEAQRQHEAEDQYGSATTPPRPVAHVVPAQVIHHAVVEHDAVYTAAPTRYAAVVRADAGQQEEAGEPSRRSARDDPAERSRRARDVYVDHRYPDSAPPAEPVRAVERLKDGSLRQISWEEPDEDVLLRELDEEEFPEAATRRSLRASAPGRAPSQEFSEVSLSDPEAEANALEFLRSNAHAIRRGNQAVYQRSKSAQGEPIAFRVFGGDSTLPVLVLDGAFDVLGAAVPTYAGILAVREKAGGLRAKAGRFLRAKPADKLSAGTLAGTMEVTRTGEAPVDRPQLQRLLKKNGITDKSLLP